MKFRHGIFQVLNKQANKIYLKTSTDLDRAFNADIFQLKAGMHSNKALQDDWNALGAENFDFQLFDELNLKGTETKAEIDKELKELIELHKAELSSTGQLLY
jgi:hypothetical protein